MHHVCGAYALLHIVSVFESLVECNLVRKFERTADRETECKAGDFHAKRFDELRDISGSRIALNGWIGCHNDLIHAAVLHSSDQ